MLNNFSGTARRRNINLSTVERKNRKELIDKAAKERERRAYQRVEFDKTLILQKCIRRHLSLKKVYTDCLHELPDSSFHTSLLNTYYPTFVQFDYKNNFKLLLEIISTVKSHVLGDRIVETILLSINEIDRMHDPQSQTVISQLWAVLNHADAFNDIHNLELLKYIRNLREYQTNDCNFIQTLNKNIDIQLLIGILAENYLRMKDEKVLPNLIALFSQITINGMKYSHLDLKLESTQSFNNAMTNISLFFNKAVITTQSAKLYFLNFVLDLLHSNDMMGIIEQENVNLSNTTVDHAFILNYDEFHNCIVEQYVLQQKHSLPEILIILKYSSANCYQQNIVSFLVQGFVLPDLYHSVVISSQLQYLELLIDFTTVYLFTKSDLEIWSSGQSDGKDPLSLDQLYKMTIALKDTLFQSLWSTGTTNHSDINKTTQNKVLKLLKTIQVRDNRAKFFSKFTANGETWTVLNEEFTKIDITQLFIQFEEYYREVSDKIEEETAYNDVLRTAQLRDLTNDIIDKFIERKQLMRQASKRQIQKFEILGKFPSFISFEERVYWFQNAFINLEKKKLGVNEEAFFNPWLMRNNTNRIEATISRDNTLEDSYNAFDSLGEKFKGRLNLTFTNEFGEEAGIDGGGLTKEFLTSIAEEGFTKHPELFVESDSREVYCKPYNSISEKNYHLIRFMGKCLGKCLYENVLIDIQFSIFFLNKLLKCDRFAGGYKSSFDELSSMDSQLYQNLMKLWTMTPQQLLDLSLTFEISDEENPYGEMIELVPNGSQIAVNKNNVLEYMNRIADYKMNSKKFLTSMKAFIEGFNTIIPQHWIGLFSPLELQKLISGGESNINISDLKAHTEYGGYLQTDQTICDLWDVLENEFDDKERAKFVKFVTSVPKAPLSGFKSLSPLFGIRNAGREVGKLPTSSTCVNLLKLPDYQNRSTLIEKLRKSIHSESGFDLS